MLFRTNFSNFLVVKGGSVQAAFGLGHYEEKRT